MTLCGHQGRHKFQRIVRLEERRLRGNHGIVGGVGAVKAVPREKFDIPPHSFSGIGGNALLCRAFQEHLLVFLHQVLDLLGDGLADAISFTRFVSRHRHSDLHNLFLVNDNTVGVVQNIGQNRMAELDFLLAVHPADVGRNVLHWAGAVKRQHGDDVLELARL